MSNEPRRALVTGSSSGIGLALAQRLLQDGWQVTGFDKAPAPLAHPAFLPVQVDLCDAAATRQATRAALDSGPVHALLHAAGVLRVGPLGTLNSTDGALMWHSMYRPWPSWPTCWCPPCRRQGMAVCC